MGNIKVLCHTDTLSASHTATLVNDEWRGKVAMKDMFNKDFTIAYDKIICLQDGQYKLTRVRTTNYHSKILINGGIAAQGDPNSSGVTSMQLTVNINLKRGDFVQEQGGNKEENHAGGAENVFMIERV